MAPPPVGEGKQRRCGGGGEAKLLGYRAAAASPLAESSGGEGAVATRRLPSC